MRRLRPTALGVKSAGFYVLILAAFYAVPYGNLFFLLLVFLGTLGLLHAWWSLRNVAGIRARVADPGARPARSTIPLKIRVDGRARARFKLEFVATLAGSTHRIGEVAWAREQHDAQGELAALPRGIHRVERAALRSTYPLGMLRATRAIEAPDEIVVHPAPSEVPKVVSVRDFVREVESRRSDATRRVTCSWLREYRTGDELRTIHWRASARRGEWIVKEFEDESDSLLEVVLDRRASREDFEEALSILAALAILAFETKEAFVLRTQGGVETYGACHRSLAELWRLLAELTPLEANDAGLPLRSPDALHLPMLRGSAS